MQATFRRLLLRLPQIAESPGLRPSPLSHRLPALFVLGCVLWTTAGTLSVYPHQLAYFNEAAGGLENGHEHLLGSSLDWGQDLLILRDLIENSQPQLSVRILFRTHYEPSDIGFPVRVHSDQRDETASAGNQPTEVLYVISASCLFGRGPDTPRGFGSYAAWDQFRSRLHDLNRAPVTCTSYAFAAHDSDLLPAW